MRHHDSKIQALGRKCCELEQRFQTAVLHGSSFEAKTLINENSKAKQLDFLECV